MFNVPEGTIKARKSRDEKKGIMWTKIIDAELIESEVEDNKSAKEEFLKDLTRRKEEKLQKKIEKSNEIINLNKYLPSDLVQLMNDIEGMTVVDHLWAQIKMSFAGILRAHKIMWVKDAEDDLSAPVSEGADGASFKVAFAYERYEAYIRTMTKAYNEHNKTIEQFLKLADKNDPRRIKVIHMDLNVDKLQAETELAKLKVQEAKGLQKDTGMLETLVDSQKQFEELFKEGKFDDFVGEKQ